MQFLKNKYMWAGIFLVSCFGLYYGQPIHEYETLSEKILWLPLYLSPLIVAGVIDDGS